MPGGLEAWGVWSHPRPQWANPLVSGCVKKAGVNFSLTRTRQYPQAMPEVIKRPAEAGIPRGGGGAGVGVEQYTMKRIGGGSTNLCESKF